MITGSIVALVTPMHDNGEIDWAKLEALLDWQIAEGIEGIVPMGTTGESATVTMEEHREVVRFAVEKIGGRVPVIAGTGANSTAEAIELTTAAKEAGADACLLVTPYYNKPTQEGLFLHYEAIAKAVDIPQVLYNVPGRTACDMQAATVARLAEIPQVIAIKEATGDLARAREIRELCEIVILSGDDATSCDLILEGADGTISVTANVAPRLLAEMVKAARAGNADEAKKIDAKLMGLHTRLFLESNPIPVKWALQQMGRIDGGIRLPMTPLAPQFHEQVLEAMREAGVLN